MSGRERSTTDTRSWRLSREPEMSLDKLLEQLIPLEIRVARHMWTMHPSLKVAISRTMHPSSAIQNCYKISIVRIEPTNNNIIKICLKTSITTTNKTSRTTTASSTLSKNWMLLTQSKILMRSTPSSRSRYLGVRRAKALTDKTITKWVICWINTTILKIRAWVSFFKAKMMLVLSNIIPKYVRHPSWARIQGRTCSRSWRSKLISRKTTLSADQSFICLRKAKVKVVRWSSEMPSLKKRKGKIFKKRPNRMLSTRSKTHIATMDFIHRQSSCRKENHLTRKACITCRKSAKQRRDTSIFLRFSKKTR